MSNDHKSAEDYWEDVTCAAQQYRSARRMARDTVTNLVRVAVDAPYEPTPRRALVEPTDD